MPEHVLLGELQITWNAVNLSGAVNVAGLTRQPWFFAVLSKYTLKDTGS